MCATGGLASRRTGSVLLLTGPYGAWKTMILRMIGMICDPSVGGVRGMPTDPDDVEPVLASGRFTGIR